MPIFARKIAYAGYSRGFMALVELAGKKGGTPKGFLLYRSIVQYGGGTPYLFEMINLRQPRNTEEAKKFFLFEEGNKFPGHKSILWKKTTGWLYRVAVGGSYEQFPKGTWVRVPKPSPWSRRRKKKQLIIGSASHLLLAEQKRQHLLKETLSVLSHETSMLEFYDDASEESFVPSGNIRAYEAVEREIIKIEEETYLSSVRILNIKDELRFALARKTGKPYFPRDIETGNIRKGA